MNRNTESLEQAKCRLHSRTGLEGLDGQIRRRRISWKTSKKKVTLSRSVTSCGVIWARGKAKTEREGPLLFLNGEQETLKYIYWIGFFLFAQTESFFDLKNKNPFRM